MNLNHGKARITNIKDTTIIRNFHNEVQTNKYNYNEMNQNHKILRLQTFKDCEYDNEIFLCI